VEARERGVVELEVGISVIGKRRWVEGLAEFANALCYVDKVQAQACSCSTGRGLQRKVGIRMGY